MGVRRRRLLLRCDSLSQAFLPGSTVEKSGKPPGVQPAPVLDGFGDGVRLPAIQDVGEVEVEQLRCLVSAVWCSWGIE